MLVLAWIPWLNDAASASVDETLKRALGTYGVARLLHGAVAVLQNTQLGIGVTLAPGQILAPAAEMLKQFSDIMLLACSSLALQKILIVISGHWISVLLLTVCAATWSVLLAVGRKPYGWVSSMTWFLIFFRFAVPISVLGSDLAFHTLLSRDYKESHHQLATVSEFSQKSVASGDAVGAEKGGVLGEIIEKSRGLWGTMIAKYTQLRNMVAMSAEHVVRLIGIFVAQTIVLPLVLLFGLFFLMKALVSRRWPVQSVSA